MATNTYLYLKINVGDKGPMMSMFIVLQRRAA